LAVVATAALAFAGAAPAASLTGVERIALAKLKRAQAAGRVDAPTAAAARSEIARAAHLVRTLPNGRGYHVGVALQEAAAFQDALTEPRALALYGALRANDDYFARHWAPADKTDVVGADGVVYRYFGGHCFRFHPLANFGVLNARATAGDVPGTTELADALAARGVYQQGGGIAWEYDFPFGGGRAPWLSGMAQAVAAQAFARAAQVAPERSTAYLRDAAAAYRVIPKRLLTSVPAGPWIRLYSFDSLTVLNAQLQATISLQAYAASTGDTAAGALAARMQNAVAVSLPRFDTGYWSYYALPHEPSPPDYHRYVVQLLTKLAGADTRFAEAAKRFAAYEKQPPAFQLANAGVGQVRFWLSKPATVRVDTAAGATKRISLLDGWHTFTWQPARAGVYSVHVSATDWPGNSTEFDALPIVLVGPGSVAATAKAPAAPPPLVVSRRVAVVWPDGATTADPALTALLAQIPDTANLLVELSAATPTTDAFVQYAADLAVHVPTLRYLAVPPATVAAVRDPVHAVAPAVAVGAFVDTVPRTPPLADFLAVRRLTTMATTLPVLLDQPLAAAVNDSACNPQVGGFTLDTTAVDSTTAAAIDAARRGIRVCPGLAAAAAAAAVFPLQVVSRQSVSFQLSCVRDCLYLATLLAADGRPVVARRGSLRGGAAATVTLPPTTLGQATYTVDVRVVSRVNPGVLAELVSDPLPRS
jgi:hypothetical protein